MLMMNDTPRLPWLIAIAAVCIALGAVFLLVQKDTEVTSEPAATEEDYTPTRATLAGIYQCVPRLDGEEDEECVKGLRRDDGSYYLIDFALMSQMADPSLVIGTRIEATGVVVPIERLSTDHWRQYPVVAVFSVTSSLRQL